MKCRLEFCNKDALKGNRDGLCGGHKIQKRKGYEFTPLRPRKVAVAWLEAHVTYTGDECLMWPFSMGGPERRGAVRFRQKNHSPAWAMCVLAKGEPPSSIHEAAHLCGKGHLGCVNPQHLSWKTPKENAADKFIHGTQPMGETSYLSKLTERQVLAIKEFCHTCSDRTIAELFGVSRGAIRWIRIGYSWKHVKWAS